MKVLQIIHFCTTNCQKTVHIREIKYGFLWDLGHKFSSDDASWLILERLEKLFLLCRGKTSRGQYCHWKWHFPSKAWKMVTQQQIIKCKEMIKIAFYSWETLCSTAHCHSPPLIHIIAVILKLVWKMFKLERKWCVCLWLFAYSQSPDIWKVIRFSVVFILLLQKKNHLQASLLIMAAN